MTGSVVHTLPTGDQIQIVSVPGATPQYYLNGVRQYMNREHGRFVVAGSDSTPYLLMIADYMWWTNNEREILNWMNDNLPRGIDHQQGMVLTFDSDKQRMMFLLRWA